jgi:hypothetical protein
MNTRTVSGKPKNIPIKRSAALDEKLAFVDHVCALLIESRLGANATYTPFSYFGSESAVACGFIRPNANAVEQETVFLLSDFRNSFVQPPACAGGSDSYTARSAAPANRRSSPAARDSCMGARVTNVNSLSPIDLSQPRGSPSNSIFEL